MGCGLFRLLDVCTYRYARHIYLLFTTALNKFANTVSHDLLLFRRALARPGSVLFCWNKDEQLVKHLIQFHHRTECQSHQFDHVAANYNFTPLPKVVSFLPLESVRPMTAHISYSRLR